MFKVSEKKIKYTKKPENPYEYTEKMDRIYTRYAKAYDGFIKVFPLWKKWLKSVLAYMSAYKRNTGGIYLPTEAAVNGGSYSVSKPASTDNLRAQTRRGRARINGL